MPYLSKLTKRLSLAWVGVLLGSGCIAEAATEPEDPGAVPDVVSVRVLPESLDVRVGATRQLVAEPLDEMGRLMPAEPVSWASSDTSIIVVDTVGRIRALRHGAAQVTARVRHVNGRSMLRSTLEPVASVTLSPAQASLQVNGQLVLQATARSAADSVITGRPVVWTSSATAVATVDSLGRVIARAIGTATITADVEGRQGTTAMTVIAAPPAAVASVTVGPASATAQVGGTANFSATLRDAAGNVLTGRAISWSSTSTGIATITSGGIASAVAVGTTTIRATSEGQSGTATFTVTAVPPAAVASVTVGPTSATAQVGGTAPFTATLRDAAGNVLTGRAISWSSTSTGIATVTSAGIASGVAVGTTTIRATSEGQTGSATLTVTAPPPAAVASVTVGPASAVALVGGTAPFTVTLRDALGNVLTGRAVNWTSTNAAVATVSSAGIATGVAVGTTTIRATSEGQVGSATLTVSAPLPPPGPGSVTFASDWSAGTGSSMSAVTDGGRWPLLGCSSYGNVLSVVPGSAVGFALTTNVLRLQMRGPNHCGMLQKDDAVPISTTHWGRFWVRNDEVGTQNYHAGAYHNLHGSDDIQGIPFARDARFTNNTWKLNVIIQAPYPYNQWRSPALQNGVWYRYEWEMRYVTATTYRIYPRIYDVAGNLVYDASHFQQNDWSRPSDLTLNQYWALDGGTRTTSLGGGNPGGANAELARNFGLGTEGPASAGDTGGYWYYARFALSTAGWIGP